MFHVVINILGSLRTFTLSLLRGAKSGPDDQIQSGIFTSSWLELPDFMTLFLLTFARSQRGHFLKKRKSIFEKSKKMIWQLQHQRVPHLDENSKDQNFSLIWKNKSYFYTWIWIRNVLSFLLMYIFYLLLKISNFMILCLKNIIFDLRHSGAYNSKRRLYSGLFLVSMDSQRSKYLSCIKLWVLRGVLTTVEGLILSWPNLAPLSS